MTAQNENYSVQKSIKIRAFQVAAKRLESGGIVYVDEMAAELYPELPRPYAKQIVRTCLGYQRRELKNKKNIITFSEDNKVKKAVDSTEYRISANRVRERAAEAIDSFTKIIDIAIRKYPNLLEEFSLKLFRIANKANNNYLALKSGEEDESSTDSNK